MSDIAKALAKYKATEDGNIGMFIDYLQSEYMAYELEFWAQLFESEVASDPEGAATEEPPRAEAAAACRTLIRFFRTYDDE